GGPLATRQGGAGGPAGGGAGAGAGGPGAQNAGPRPPPAQPPADELDPRSTDPRSQDRVVAGTVWLDSEGPRRHRPVLRPIGLPRLLTRLRNPAGRGGVSPNDPISPTESHAHPFGGMPRRPSRTPMKTSRDTTPRQGGGVGSGCSSRPGEREPRRLAALGGLRPVAGHVPHLGPADPRPHILSELRRRGRRPRAAS